MTDRTGEVLCDVRELPPPEPMHEVLKVLETLKVGHYVRMMHRMEPVPLYQVLESMGFTHHLHLGGEAPFEVMIWHQGDHAARSKVEAVCPEL